VEKICEAQEKKFSHCCLILFFHWSIGIFIRNKNNYFIIKSQSLTATNSILTQWQITLTSASQKILKYCFGGR
jgi:hypothetical protein